jgi:uncharacterized membrane protein YgcG
MGASEVVKMYQGGIKKDVIISYINNTSLPYHMGADGVAYLHSLGVPQDIIQAMIQRDARLQKIQAMQQSTPPSAAPNGVQATAQSGRIVAPSTPPPNIAVIPGGDYGYPYYYDYEYPYYDYGVYGPPIIIGGWGWGGGRGHGGFHGGFGGVHGGGGFHGGGGHGGGGHR